MFFAQGAESQPMRSHNGQQQPAAHQPQSKLPMNPPVLPNKKHQHTLNMKFPATGEGEKKQKQAMLLQPGGGGNNGLVDNIASNSKENKSAPDQTAWETLGADYTRADAAATDIQYQSPQHQALALLKMLRDSRTSAIVRAKECKEKASTAKEAQIRAGEKEQEAKERLSRLERELDQKQQEADQAYQRAVRAAELQRERDLRRIEKALGPQMAEAQEHIASYKQQKRKQGEEEARLELEAKDVASRIVEYDAQITAQERKYKAAFGDGDSTMQLLAKLAQKNRDLGWQIGAHGDFNNEAANGYGSANGSTGGGGSTNNTSGRAGGRDGSPGKQGKKDKDGLDPEMKYYDADSGNEEAGDGLSQTSGAAKKRKTNSICGTSTFANLFNRGNPSSQQAVPANSSRLQQETQMNHNNRLPQAALFTNQVDHTESLWGQSDPMPRETTSTRPTPVS
ncbi:unnamed protein product [Amoebophrya sp. A120]|nr:unnamed protein product [Amoebophrya sp. A120]|eukprot:GSA120T00025847001.1